MKWGQKWGKNPTTKVHSYWGKLKNEIVSSITFADGGSAVKAIVCDTTYVVVPAFGSSIHTTFTYPYVSPSITVALRNPKFGNSKTVDTNALVRRSKGGELQTYKDTNWPSFTTLRFVIENLSPTDVANLRSFINQCTGKKIGLLDYTNRQWSGIIISEKLDVIKVGKDDCTYQGSFEFMGSLT